MKCPRGWTRYDRSKACFLVLPQRLRWAEAERACGKSGGRLASITDEYENAFVFNLAKKANLTTPTVWLGRLVRLARTGAYEWHDGAIGRQADGFRGEPPSGTDLCLTMWLDFDRPEGSWNEWDCGYATGYSALCKKSLKKSLQLQLIQRQVIYHSVVVFNRDVENVALPMKDAYRTIWLVPFPFLH
ncbi:lectin C-type domain protein [Necator americanus]|uniref:Lectin C-type domain protein n=1 Tax=Necator americanus TaxID=51031 RepID=W2T3C1_NECAM|nr:lectin C-type domain protein [Necator americanus]ETN76505.1 lectin C-type domain protein [Necator americanus]